MKNVTIRIFNCKSYSVLIEKKIYLDISLWQTHDSIIIKQLIRIFDCKSYSILVE